MYSILNAAVADIPLIRELTFKVWPQTYAPILSREKIDYMLDMMYSESSLERQMNEGCQFIIVYEGTEPVGFASYQEIEPSVFKLHKIYVLPSQQGKGTGKFMIDHIIDTIRPSGALSVQLQVNRNNKAKGFYEKIGFAVIDEIDLDIGGGHFMNDYVMEKKIS
ncbi:MAG TPA: GNAT family N-acetyltransferase [Chitinophagaceae bacterium]|nr:GNAT family N-acetyltransferase [Chitinophagaceae bacterium]